MELNTLEQIGIALFVIVITYLYYRLQYAEKRLAEYEKSIPAFAVEPKTPGGKLDPSKLLDSMKTLLEDYENRISGAKKKKVKIFMDGAFDLTHYGHFNAFRQARMLGDHLVVGVNSDESILKCKGPPILNDEERQATVLSCRFVDEIVPQCPYVMTEEYIQKIMEEYDIDFFVHGDDPCTVDGKDVYGRVKQMGKFKTIPRTEGVSSTDIVGRMMMLTNNVRMPDTETVMLEAQGSSTLDNDGGCGTPTESRSLRKRMSQDQETLDAPARNFYPTSRMLRCFAGAIGNAPPSKEDVVVYIAGEWDMFNSTHVEILKKARALGDYLYVGVHTDENVKEYTRGRPPVFNLYERVLGVLGCKYVDDVLLGADIPVTEAQIQSFAINKVIRVEAFGLPDVAYEAARDLGILEDITNVTPLTPEKIAMRIVGNLDSIIAKHKAKAKKEQDFYKDKYAK